MNMLMIAGGTLCLVLLSLYTHRKVRNMHVLLYTLRDQAQADTAALFQALGGGW